ncbi:MAG: TraB/GumN family protein [Deltaproteobacteria bacterium]|nr:TraB/GumN family protein [Deltaproteobacteria bacterium]
MPIWSSFRTRPSYIALFLSLSFSLSFSLAFGAGCATDEAARPQKSKTTQLSEKSRRSAAAPEPFFWRVEAKDGRPGIVYLLGTMHLVRVENRGLDVEVLKVRDRAHTLALELDPDAVSAEQMQLLIIQKGMFAEGESLEERFSTEDWQLAVKTADDVSLPVMALKRMRPWLASLTLAVLTLKKLGYDENDGVERQLLVGRGSRKQKVVSLESAELQMNTLASFDDDVQVKQMNNTLHELAKGGEDMHKLEKLFVEGDDQGLIELLTSSKEREDPVMDRYYKTLLDDRNVGMQKRITRFFEEPGETLVAVGAAHLVGEKGLVQMFQDAGYEVRRVPGGGKSKGASTQKVTSAEASSSVTTKSAVIQLPDGEVTIPAKPRHTTSERSLPDGSVVKTRIFSTERAGVAFGPIELAMPKTLPRRACADVGEAKRTADGTAKKEASDSNSESSD